MLSNRSNFATRVTKLQLYTLRWRHNDHAGVSNHQPHGCLLNRLFSRKSKKTSKLRVTGLCAGNSPGTGEFPAQMASYAENVSIWWRHHDLTYSSSYVTRVALHWVISTEQPPNALTVWSFCPLNDTVYNKSKLSDMPLSRRWIHHSPLLHSKIGWIMFQRYQTKFCMSICLNFCFKLGSLFCIIDRYQRWRVLSSFIPSVRLSVPKDVTAVTFLGFQLSA